MNQELNKYYKELFEKNGATPEAVQYSDRKSQFKRFEILTLIADDISSIVDVGCGLGDLYKFLNNKNYNGIYLGIDFVNEFICYAKQAYQNNPKAEFREFNITEEDIPKGYDYVVLSGVFNNKMDGNQEFMLRTVEKMFDACNKGVAFNAMSTYVDYQDDHLYYSNPLEVFDFCKKKLTAKVILKHDYVVKENSIPFEYTMYLYKQ